MGPLQAVPTRAGSESESPGGGVGADERSSDQGPLNHPKGLPGWGTGSWEGPGSVAPPGGPRGHLLRAGRRWA